MPKYVIKIGNKVIHPNHERMNKMELKGIRDDIAAERGMTLYHSLSETDPNSDEEAAIQRDIERERRAGRLPYLSREAT